MSTVERIKSICKERGIAISKLEQDLEWGNAYVSGLKKGTIPDDRLYQVSQYLGVSMDYLVTGKEPHLSDEAAYLNLEILKDKELQESLKKYFALSEKEQSHVKELIDLLSR